ncbi:MAG: hypothetical protein APR63_04730 [Desulfuromonas sp. SDB]|nr:MAG: hypothetical protein APR63_04730 [Desulfuromonas sp. SDB]
MDLSLTIGDRKFDPGIWLSSGIIGMGLEFQELINFQYVGAIVTKSISLHPKPGNPPPRLAETTGGLLNSIGLANPGLAEFTGSIISEITQLNIPIIVNVVGDEIEEYLEVSRELDKIDQIAGLEINISCPNVSKGGLSFQKDLTSLKKLLWLIRTKVDKILVLKLNASLNNFIDVAKLAENIGFNAVSMVNTYPGMRFDIETRNYALGNKTGGLSGPAIKPMALWAVYQLSSCINIPIVGGGGIVNWEDAVEFYLAGARGINIGTALFSEPNTPEMIVKGLVGYLKHNNLNSVSEITVNC